MHTSAIRKPWSRRWAGSRCVLLGAVLVGAVIIGLLAMHTLNLHGTPAARTSAESVIDISAPHAQAHDGAAELSESACPHCNDSPSGLAMMCLFLVLLGFALIVPLRPWGRRLMTPVRAGPIAGAVLSAVPRAPCLEELCISRT